MPVGPDQEPWTELPRPSTTKASKSSKIRRPRRVHSEQRRAAAPHRLARLYGLQTPVTLTLRIRVSTDVWVEVLSDQGRFFVPFDGTVYGLVQQVIQGGHRVDPMSTTLASEHRRGVQALGDPPPEP